jgi:hypothetical protein
MSILHHEQGIDSEIEASQTDIELVFNFPEVAMHTDINGEDMIIFLREAWDRYEEDAPELELLKSSDYIFGVEEFLKKYYSYLSIDGSLISPKQVIGFLEATDTFQVNDGKFDLANPNHVISYYRSLREEYTPIRSI